MSTQSQFCEFVRESTEFVKGFNLTVLRRTRADTPRPYRAFGYSVSPAIYIAMALFIEIVLSCCKPQYTWPGLIIVPLGIPLYLFWSRGARLHRSISELQNEAG